MAKYVPKTESLVLGTGTVNLQVANLNGQYAVSMARLNGNVLVIGSVINIALGDVNNCRGKVLYIEAAIRDVLTETDNVSITITLQDGSVSRTFEYFDIVSGPGEAVVFEVTINLQ